MKATECKYCKITMQLIAQAHREGWEQGKKEAMNKVYAEGSVSCNYCSDIADTIAAMEYREKKEDLKNWCAIEGVAP